MRRALAAAFSAFALALAPAPASADQMVQAVDGTPADNFNNRWDPPQVTIKAGETVTWNFTGTLAPHNVAALGGNWTFRNDIPKVAPPPASFLFSTPGVYAFVCEVHSGMTGQVVVTDASGAPPPPPPPPPLSEQAWPNDQAAPTAFDVADVEPPRIGRVRATPMRYGARVRLWLSERARVTVRIKLAGITVRTARAELGAGTDRLTIRDRRLRGRYRLDVLAHDLAGNRSRVAHARLTAPRPLT